MCCDEYVVMKKSIIILILFHTSLFTLHLTAQPCLPDGIEFTTQAQIDNFQTNYPTCTEIAGYVIISDNQSGDITNLNGLSVLTSIWGNLFIGETYYTVNSILTSLTGLDNVTSIGGDFMLWGNYALTSLTGLDNVTSIGGKLEVSGNKSLISLMGLDNINAASITDLHIGCQNNQLSTCEVQSVCDYLASPTGTIYISGNATGCNSQAEVEAACATVTVDEINLAENISVYPNPAKDILTISCQNGVTIEELIIYNQTGQKVFAGELLDNTIDV